MLGLGSGMGVAFNRISETISGGVREQTGDILNVWSLLLYPQWKHEDDISLSLPVGRAGNWR